MNHSPAATNTAPSFQFCPHGYFKFSDFRHVQKLFVGSYGLVLQRKELHRLKFVVSAELPRPITLNFGLDSQTYQPHDVNQLRWIGPVPGDIAEVEAYCRIFRAAEVLHTTLMNMLCDPLTGVCTVSYDFSSEVLEDKIVTVLGWMISLLNKGRQDVLSGRSSLMTSFRVEEINTMEDKLPPLATFRSEIKRCCESLHVALENYLTPGDDKNLDVWRKLQRLKNVCYDLGFQRGEESPSHMLFANWVPVSMSTSKEDITPTDSDVAFWRGGQVTEEGLQWLLDKGFRTIVDLRAETVNDNFYQVAIDEAVGSGKVELIKLPVEIGTSPSMEQVEKISSLVSDPSRRPLYLHSKEGVWRTSAVVSRWRQYVARYESQHVSNSPIPVDGTLVQGRDGMSSTDAPSSVNKEKQLKDGNALLPNMSDYTSSFNGVLHGQDSVIIETNVQQTKGGHIIHSGGMSLTEVNSSMLESGTGANINPFKSQLPPNNVLSRKEMSRFFGSRKISPSTFVKTQRRSSVLLPSPRETYTSSIEKMEQVRMESESVLTEPENSNGSTCSTDSSLSDLNKATGNGTTLAYRDASSGTIVNGDRPLVIRNDVVTSVTNKNLARDTSDASKSDQMSNGHSSVVPGEKGVDENMCASATGVVRIQSRKKAEMFLVRTDGFSCTREKVTESSLAFTHPSTQQQMLMWKSTPKTVLLLKKLGPELMEEAKDVAYFLYYQEKMNVLVEPDVHDIFARIPGFGFVQTFYGQDTSDLHEKVDFVACLGGDGVILHASNLFRDAVPPVVSFNLGSLGFLTSHSFDDYKQDLRQVIHGNNTTDGVYITLRMRLRCEVFRNGKAMPGKIFDVLNEVVVDRGSNPYLSKIECYEHDRLITKVQGDGIIVATPTGSTAYSTAAGGSMVHPNVPCMLFTPICPHSLSFRPVILPDSARLELKVPDDARSNAWVSFDGKRRQQLSRGDSVRISMSQHPIPTVNKADQTGDWFHSLIRCLNWNERLDQKAL
ncbi:NAD kinase 2, chloroplastic-like [Chenopodium quinoa]|uniref:NAD kinase 2, chloroplastic-like n=1 Tax=Chenopodium quinoa TaxID=63459 RepID=UPI000B78E89F|nr:NAD kinase 2, chloroplastic-like [Chenopodium quinoa]